jgi:ABC-type sugar transport system ATPase subunit
MMVGREVNLAGGPRQGSRGDAVLHVKDLHTARLRGVSFTLHRGEVLGVAGLVGAGRSELGAAVFGLDRFGAATYD